MRHIQRIYLQTWSLIPYCVFSLQNFECFLASHLRSSCSGAKKELKELHRTVGSPMRVNFPYCLSILSFNSDTFKWSLFFSLPHVRGAEKEETGRKVFDIDQILLRISFFVLLHHLAISFIRFSRIPFCVCGCAQQKEELDETGAVIGKRRQNMQEIQNEIYHHDRISTSFLLFVCSKVSSSWWNDYCCFYSLLCPLGKRLLSTSRLKFASRTWPLQVLSRSLKE